jgi:hypothetical protein
LSITGSLPRSIEPKVGVGHARRWRVDRRPDIGLDFPGRAFAGERVSCSHCGANEKGSKKCALAGRAAERDTYGHGATSPRRLHPLPLRIMFLRFPDAVVIGKWAQYGLQWHFFAMWIFVLNRIAYFCYGIISGRFWHKLFPISPREVFVTVGEALRFRLRHIRECI